ncbi:hypothetical protein Aab01nite_35010 [Paractinoplanes abujensis]|nr:hypothetical protein Aab01nite_35010 [Actinoplanes abujensis]
MDEARAELARMREAPEAWAELRNDTVRRAKVLWALQYDRRPEDLALLRSLVEQEAACCRESPGRGLGEEAELAGFLLAEHRRVEDVWRHWAIKQSNFDAGCAYDVQYLFAAGVETTLAFVRADTHPQRDALLERLTEEALTDEDVAEWARVKGLNFPADPAHEEPLTWVDRALSSGDRQVAGELLRQWAAGPERDEETLRYYRGAGL